jgi:hypothetical protein
MAYRIGVRPGKAVSVAGMVVGGLFLLLGIAVIVPTFGAFGLVWTAFAGIIALYYAFSFFSSRGALSYEVDVESSDTVEDLDVSLRRLAKLKEDGLVTDQEYEQHSAEVLRRR